MSNNQMYRHITNPGWSIGWTWTKKEVIWSIAGAQATNQGDCSKFKGNIPHCCKKTTTVIDLLPRVTYNQQFSNCCKIGVLGLWRHWDKTLLVQSQHFRSVLAFQALLIKQSRFRIIFSCLVLDQATVAVLQLLYHPQFPSYLIVVV